MLLMVGTPWEIGVRQESPQCLQALMRRNLLDLFRTKDAIAAALSDDLVRFRHGAEDGRSHDKPRTVLQYFRYRPQRPSCVTSDINNDTIC
jgi:hypothetical protein